MAYFVPYIDETGLHIPTFNDVLNDIISFYKQLFGNDIYLDNDSMDYQQISILAKYVYDTYLTLQVAYSSRTPLSAVGIGLDALGPLFSVTRRPATKSSVSVTVTGASGTVITNGRVSDGVNSWDLPETVTIPDTETITVTATSSEYGAFYVPANTVNTILTPVFGWRSVTNTVASVPGQNQETDASLRNRMLVSSFIPSLTVLDGIRSGLMQLSGMEDVVVYENDTNSADANGIPAHSICCVVDGDAADEDIAYQIYIKKTPGIGTYGTKSYTSKTFYGNDITVYWFDAVKQEATVTISVTSLDGYSTQDLDRIKSAVISYVKTLSFGDTLYEGAVMAAAQSAVVNPNKPSFVVTAATVTDGTADFKTKIDVSEDDITFSVS